MTTKGKTLLNLTFAVNVKRVTKVVCHTFQKVKSGWKVSEHDFQVVPVKNFRNGKFSGAKEVLKR